MGRAMVGLAALYAIGAVVTFGHAAAAAEHKAQADYATCLRVAEHPQLCFRDEAGPGASGMMAAVLWPFYLSWEAWS